MPSGWEVFVKLAATACDLHNIHRRNVQEENVQYQVSQEVLENGKGLPLAHLYNLLVKGRKERRKSSRL